MRNLMAVILGLAGLAGAQPAPKTEGARDLFFAGAAAKDSLPPIAKSAKSAAGTKSAGRGAKAGESAAAALHLGLRYTLLLVDDRTHVGAPVDPTRNFRKGECVAMNIEANRSGYLYVLAKESGGDWEPLFPTPEAPGEDNRIDPGQVVRTPRESCFEIEDPPGTETLFVVLSRDPRDIDQLAESVKLPREKARQTAQAAPVNGVVEQMTANFGTRDLTFREAAPPPAAVRQTGAKGGARAEPRHAVYVVSGSAKPAATLVTRIEINHK
ncbi:MAG: DUF4384 domain-containing protein [Acidobacteria bacterium]|nr:DUF4384 domain-containing protein [Acidobacteriota bacterium]